MKGSSRADGVRSCLEAQGVPAQLPCSSQGTSGNINTCPAHLPNKWTRSCYSDNCSSCLVEHYQALLSITSKIPLGPPWPLCERCYHSPRFTAEKSSQFSEIEGKYRNQEHSRTSPDSRGGWGKTRVWGCARWMKPPGASSASCLSPWGPILLSQSERLLGQLAV